MENLLSIQIVVIAAASMFAQWAAWRLKIPAIVFLLAFGFLLGPIAGVVQPSELMGDLLKPAIAAAVAIILFEGSLQLRFKELRETGHAVRRVIMIGAPLGWVLISLGANYIAGLEWPVAITLGGILVVTGPTVIIPMLRHARLSSRVGNVLKWEGIVNDPVGVIFAILSYEYFVASKDGHAGMGFFIEHGLELVAIGIASFLLAFLIKRLFERGYMPEYLKAPFLLTVVLTIFFGCNFILHESGLIAVTILGLALANIHTASLEEIKRFKETITLLLVSGVFLLLTADLDISVLLNLDWRGFLFIFFLLFIIRPLTFVLCSLGTPMTWREILLTGAIAPRGIVCAAMAGVIGPLLTEAGYPDGEKILPIAFAVVIVSVMLHSLMIRLLARTLQLTSGEANGVLIAGAHEWSVQLAEVLKARNVAVMIVDNDWQALGRARLANIPVYYGELLSEESEFALEFGSYNTLVAEEHNPAYNALICETFGHEYGKERVFRLTLGDAPVSERRKISSNLSGLEWISVKLTQQRLYELFAQGWRFRSARIGKTKDGDMIIPLADENRFLVGTISKSGKVNFYTDNKGSRRAPKEDQYMIFLENPDAQPSLTQDNS